MNKELFQKEFEEALTRNFAKQIEYLSYDYKVFFPLRGLIYQASKCLMLEFNYAAITLTNSILERLLKLALIDKEVGIRGIPTDQWNKIFHAADEKYGSIVLGNSIDLCRKENLINEREKDFLHNTIRNMVRNGFSHADAGKVLVNIPDSVRLFQGSFTDTKIEEISLNPKTIPSLQTVHIENFVNVNAAPYFEFVFGLMKQIEKRLVELDKQKPGSLFK